MEVVVSEPVAAGISGVVVDVLELRAGVAE